MKLRAAAILALTALLAIPCLRAADSDLPRRGYSGIVMGPLDDAAKKAAGVETGVLVRGVLPGSGAEAAGLTKGDVIVKAGGDPIAISPQFGAKVAALKPGDKLAVEIRRPGSADPIVKELTIGRVPLETSSDFDVVYGVASADGNRYRTILTKPKGDGPFPAVFIVQGVGCFSIDNPAVGSFSYVPVVNELTKRGYAVLRVDKPGTGDSEGGPCPAVDFPTEVHAYQAALKTLAGKPFIDAKNVFLFGHSMGGFMAPMVAEALPLRGIAVYGTGFNSWLAYTLENTRRQMRLAGADYTDIADEEKKQELFASLFYVQKMPLADIVAKYPQFKDDYPDGKTFAAGKHGKYFQQIYDFNMAKQWKPYQGAVLAMWGGSDFVSNESDHHWLADAVNAWHPGHAQFVLLDKTDHWLRTAADFATSAKQGPNGGEFNEKFNTTLLAWLDANRAK